MNSLAEVIVGDESGDIVAFDQFNHALVFHMKREDLE